MTDQNPPKPKGKAVDITTGNIPFGREKEPEKKNCACGGKGCDTKAAPETGNPQA